MNERPSIPPLPGESWPPPPRDDLLPRSSGLGKPLAIIAAIVVPIMALVGIAGSGGPSGSGGGGQEVVANDVAVGDVVTVKYPYSTIMCSDRNDAETVYIVGEVALAQDYRINNSSSKAVDARDEARKVALAQSYSCEWANRFGRDTRYTVQEKDVVGTDKGVFHTINLCLRAPDARECNWVIEDFNSYGYAHFTRYPKQATAAGR